MHIWSIYKYTLTITDEQVIRLPLRHRILSVQAQNEELCMWVRVATDDPCIDKKVYVLGTGHKSNLIKNKTYAGTVPIGSLVWHIFTD